MNRDIFFIVRKSEGVPEEPHWDLVNAAGDMLKTAGYELRFARESSYVFDQIKAGILEKGVTHYTNSVDLTEAVLPDNMKREELLDQLRYMIRNIQASQALLIIDPYLFPASPDDDYISHLEKILKTTIGSINRLEIVTRPDRCVRTETKFLTLIAAIMPNVQCRVRYTNVFHDRFWIADGVRGVFVGTSLNGVGRRYSLADYIREEDVKEIYARSQALP